MGHHGVITTASTIAMAFDHLYYLERCAELQVKYGKAHGMSSIFSSLFFSFSLIMVRRERVQILAVHWSPIHTFECRAINHTCIKDNNPYLLFIYLFWEEMSRLDWAVAIKYPNYIVAL